MTQCNDCEKVLYALGHLEGATSDWWDAYTTVHAAPNTITWQEFQVSFRTHRIPVGVKMLKQKEFLALKQGNMAVSEYLDEFTQLSCYAPYEVNTDAKRQERFLDGLVGPLDYHLQSHTFSNFQMLLNKAIGLENKRKELGEQSASFSLRDSLAATLALVTTHHRALRFVLADKAETMDKINSFIIRLSNPKNSTQ
jgi:hypothetical protein